MNNKYVITGIGIILVFFQYVFYPFFNINGIIPDITLLFLLILILKFESGFVLFLAFFLGIFQDLALTKFLGISSLSNVITIYLGIIWASHSIEVYTFLWKIFLLAFIKYLIMYYIVFLSSAISLSQIIFQYAIPYSIYTLLVSFVILLLFKNIINKYVSI